MVRLLSTAAIILAALTATPTNANAQASGGSAMSSIVPNSIAMHCPQGSALGSQSSVSYRQPHALSAAERKAHILQSIVDDNEIMKRKSEEQAARDIPVSTVVHIVAVEGASNPDAVLTAIAGSTPNSGPVILHHADPAAIMKALDAVGRVSTLRYVSVPSSSMVDARIGDDLDESDFSAIIGAAVMGEYIMLDYSVTLKAGQKTTLNTRNRVRVASNDTVASIFWKDGIATVTLIRSTL